MLTINFGANPDRYVESSSLYVSKVNAADTGMVQVQQIDFPAFLAGLRKRVAILKLDIEGAEVPILESLLNGGLIDRVDWVFAETHERIIPELAERTIALRRRVAHDGLRNISLDWA